MLRGSLFDTPPVVGDWVAVREVGDAVLIESILERRTLLTRRRVGGGAPQSIAANVDAVAVVTTPERDFNPRRLDRYLAVVRGAGCEARVVLNKADLVPDPAPFDAQVPEMLHTSTLDGRGVVALRDWIGVRTVAFLGSSGVGKSSLINTLLGTNERDTGVVSAVDDRGQHTTTTRDMLFLPGGGQIVDTPGMRELGLSRDADADRAFEDLTLLAEQCRYRNCSHDNEPGCAILAAIDAAELSPDRLRSYRKLQRESAHERRRHSAKERRAASRNWTKKIKREARTRGWRANVDLE